MAVSPCNIRVSEGEISHTARVKSYPGGRRELLVCDKPIFREPGWEISGREGPVKKGKRKETPDPKNADRAMRRAKAQLRDIALCTPFRYFVTLTLDKSKIDRYDAGEVVKRLSTWADNQVRRKGLAYVLVPERHKDGAIHFHGFFNDALPVADSGTLTMPGWGKPRKPRNKAQREAWLAEGAHVVYNLPGWTLGFTTAMELYGEYEQAVAYVCKYIGKAPEKIGGRWYYSGGVLGRPDVDYTDADIRDFQGREEAYDFSVREAGLSFSMVAVKGGEGDVANCEVRQPDQAREPGHGLPGVVVLPGDRAAGLPQVRPMDG